MNSVSQNTFSTEFVTCLPSSLKLCHHRIPSYLLAILAGQGDIREVASVSEISEGRGGRLLKLVPAQAHPIARHPRAEVELGLPCASVVER